MIKPFILAAALLTASAGSLNAQEKVNIGKSNITLKSDLMTPEALWAMGRISAYAPSKGGQKIAYQVGYYSVKENKSHHVLYMMNADGTGQQLLTTDAENETDPSWVGDRLAYLRGGEIWTMNADGTDRRQLSHTDGSVEGYKFSPDGSQVILLKSLPFHEVIKENPADLPKATGRLVTDLMYRHWDHYVESIQHPFVAQVTASGIGAGKDLLEGEPYECPMEPFGGIEQLDWSPDSKCIAYTCRKKTGGHRQDPQPVQARRLSGPQGGCDQDPAQPGRERCRQPAEQSRLRPEPAVLARRQMHRLAEHGARRL